MNKFKKVITNLIFVFLLLLAIQLLARLFTYLHL